MKLLQMNSIRPRTIYVWMLIGATIALPINTAANEKKYQLGAFSVKESLSEIELISEKSGKKIVSEKRAGGALKPDMVTTTYGNLLVGGKNYSIKTGELNRVIKNATFIGDNVTIKDSGPYKITINNLHTNTSCIFDLKVFFNRERVSSFNKLMEKHAVAISGNKNTVLVLFDDRNTKKTQYAWRSVSINTKDCVLSEVNGIAYEDDDNFFEFSSSEAGWWRTGSQDATLLLARDGGNWTKAPIPKNTHNILTARWKNNGQLWILVNYFEKDIRLALFKSNDDGKSWSESSTSDPGYPDYWFEALREIWAESK